ncbi:MAG TPA: PKD domain-containing protein [Bacteroidales bacterium]|nr:PKD domain-containing protein [Bacteroidales bacterium]
MKSIYKIIIIPAVVLLSAACTKEGSYSLTETPPLDFKTYYNGLSVSFANQAKNATGIKWNFGDNSAEASGDSVVHQFSQTGNYLISMTGTVDGKTWVFHTVLRVDKPSVISLTDNSFADWNGVTYPDFQLSGTDHMIRGKVDYDANFVYIFIEYSTAGTNGLATLDGAIMDLYMDNDNSLSTGFSSALGADLLYEGNIPADWFDFYKFSGTDQSAWSWIGPFSIPNAIAKGYSEEVTDTVRMEFGLSRDALNISKDVFNFKLVLNYSDWSAEAGSLSKDGDTRIAVHMNKQSK